MADLLQQVFNLISKRYRDMGDGSHAEVVSAVMPNDEGAGATIGATDDAAVTTDAAGTLSAKLRGIVSLLGVLGEADDAAVVTDAAGTVQQYLRGLVKLLVNVIAVKPFSAILEGGLTELVGINEQVDQNEYGEDVAVALGGSYSGEILSVALFSTEDGSGAVQTPACTLLVFDADPGVVAGDAAISAAARVTQLGRVDITTGDWTSDANGATAFKQVAIPFHALSSLFFVLRNLGSSINDAAGDDEQIEFNFWWRRES